MPRPSHSRRAEPSTITTTPPRPILPVTPELNHPPNSTMDAHRATAARMRAASGALPAFNGAEFGDGGDLDYGGGDSGEDGGLGGEEVYDEEEDELEEEEEEEEDMPPRSLSPLPDNLREISSLASWTVSTHKPGCGVAALRHASPSSYWQSDGPQPHALTLHFFKLVAVVRIRVYLDFNLDESYTPTKMVFLAGMGGNDLVEFASWEGETPTGWVDIPLEGVGGQIDHYGGEGERKKQRRRRRKTKRREAHDFGDHVDYDNEPWSDDDDYDGFEDEKNDINDNDPTAGNVLKAMVIQMKVCENHQNGKDTHVRGFQVFAQDDRVQGLGSARTRRESTRKSKHGHGEGDPGVGGADDGGRTEASGAAEYKFVGMEEPDWMGEPSIR